MSDILAQDHDEVDALFGELSNAFERGVAREVFEKLDNLWARLAIHIRAEHLHLFPALIAATAAKRDRVEEGAPSAEKVRVVVERLREDHDFFMRELASAVGDARESADRDDTLDRERLTRIRDKVSAVALRLAEHNRLEEREVYLWPESLLGRDELDALRATMRRELENLPPRFSKKPER